jgi:hypothetical protein
MGKPPFLLLFSQATLDSKPRLSNTAQSDSANKSFVHCGQNPVPKFVPELPLAIACYLPALFALKSAPVLERLRLNTCALSNALNTFFLISANGSKFVSSCRKLPR